MLWLLPLVPVAGAAGVLLLDRGPATEEPRYRRTLALVSVGSMAATGLLAALAAAGGWRGRLRWSDSVALHLDLPPFAATMAILAPLVAAAVLLYASFHEDRPELGRLVALLTAFVGGMELLVCASDLLTLLVGWELVGACSWALIAHRWRDAENPRQANIAFLVTRTGDLGLFAAAGIVFAHTGSFAFDRLGSLDGGALALVAAGIVAAAAAKSAQLPFSPWLFSAMAGPSSVSALLHSATMVAAGAFLLARLHPALALVSWFGPVVVALGVATALTGSLVGLLQTRSKKLLAASTSAHYGLMFAATGAGYPAVAMLHLVAHACFKAPLFLTAGIVKRRTGSDELEGTGFGTALPGLAAAAGLCALALGGVPPLGGAWTKEEVVTAAGHHGTWAAILVAVAGGLSAAYAARFWFQTFGFSGPSRETTRSSGAELGAVGALSIVTLVLSLAWLPGARELLASRLGGEIPPPGIRELALSIGLVVAGTLLGWILATRWPRLGEGHAAAAIGAWMGLPLLARHGIARPVLASARALARSDDRFLDGPPRRAAGLARGTSTGLVLSERYGPDGIVRGLAALGRRASSTLSAGDDRLVDAGVRAAAAFGRTLASLLGTGDDRVVDAGVRAAAAFTDRLADLAAAAAELVLDRIPEGMSRLAGLSGDQARRIQTGLAHHYYTLIVLGLAVGLTLLFLL